MAEPTDKGRDDRTPRRITIRPNPRQADAVTEGPSLPSGVKGMPEMAVPGIGTTDGSSVPSETGALHGTLSLLSDRLERLAMDMDKAQLREYVDLVHKPWLLIWRNFISGLSRGIGIALGFTFFAATIVWLLQVLGKLNLPIVGDYIADIVRIVQRQLQINPY